MRVLGRDFLRRSRPYLLFALALNGCEQAGPSALGRESLDSSEIVPQRVTATLSRYAAELVHVETERGTLVTTPEHPFAKAGWGWVAARELRPRDLVISARFGAVPVTSVRTEELAEPVAVFNFTVDRTHAYLVGSDEVLVHNANCQPAGSQSIQEMRAELEEKERELRALQEEKPSSPEEKGRLEKRMADLKKEIRDLKFSITIQRRREDRANPEKGLSELREAEAQLQSITQRMADLRERLRLLEEATPGKLEEIADLHNQIVNLEKQRTFKALDVTQLKELDELTRWRRALQSPPAALNERIKHLEKLVRQRRYDREDRTRLHSTRRKAENRRRDARSGARLQEALEEGLAAANPQVRAVLSGQVPDTEYGKLLQDLENDLQKDDPAPANESLVEAAVREFLRGLEDAQGQLRVALQRDTAAVDALSEDLAAHLRTPSPEQLPQVRESVVRLHDQLAAERAQFETNYAALGTQEAILTAALQRGGSSRAPANLESVRERRGWLREDWQQRMQNRLADASRQLRDMQSRAALRDEEIEAELAEHISVLRDELANPPFDL